MLAWIEEARAAGAEILTGGELDGELLRPDRDRERGAGAEGLLRGGLRPVCTVKAVRLARRGDRARERHALRAAGGRSSRADVKTALAAAQRLEFGGVTVNEAPTFRADQMPYGGVKDSGNTREGPAYAVRELTEERLVVLQL